MSAIRFWIATRMPVPDWLWRFVPGRVIDYIASWAYDDPKEWRREFGG